MPHDMEMALGTALHKIGVNITDEYIIKEHEQEIDIPDNAGQFFLY